ncbi:MAG: metallophosphatase family protein [Proteobacteria bacterium]|nr:metallophosphatase family protein [Pseudomonadota bacterium]
MRLALISDIHANKAALEAVLNKIGPLGADRIVCLGDVATLGPEPLGHAEYAVLEVKDGHTAVGLHRIPFDDKAFQDLWVMTP